jgi:hypothetical protein
MLSLANPTTLYNLIGKSASVEQLNQAYRIAGILLAKRFMQELTSRPAYPI